MFRTSPMCMDLSISSEKSTAGIGISGFLVCINGVNCMGKPPSWCIPKASLRGCDQYLRSSISWFSHEPSPSGNSTLPVALRFESKSTRAINLDMSARGKRFLNSEKAWAFAASERCLASEELNHFHSALKLLVSAFSAGCLLDTYVK